MRAGSCGSQPTTCATDHVLAHDVVRGVLVAGDCHGVLAYRVEPEECVRAVEDEQLERRRTRMHAHGQAGRLHAADVAQLVKRLGYWRQASCHDLGHSLSETPDHRRGRPRCTAEQAALRGPVRGRGSRLTPYRQLAGSRRPGSPAGPHLVQRLLEDAEQGLSAEPGEVDGHVGSLLKRLARRAVAVRPGAQLGNGRTYRCPAGRPPALRRAEGESRSGRSCAPRRTARPSRYLMEASRRDAACRC
jgi:hypothetical protein